MNNHFTIINVTGGCLTKLANKYQSIKVISYTNKNDKTYRKIVIFLNKKNK